MSGRTDCRPTTTRYSEAFRLKVIREIECGASQAEVQRKYDIPTNATLHYWLKKYGKNHLLSKVVRVEDSSERSRIKRLEEEKAQLEKALAQTQIKLLAMESLVEVAEEHYKADFKKNFGQKPSAEHFPEKK